MKIIKYEQSCFVVEEGDHKLIIDPGAVTNLLQDYSHAAGLLITHVHADHFDIHNIRKFVQANPEAPVFAVQAVADELPDDIAATVVAGGHKTEIGPFALEFAGGKHALIHSDTPLTDNVGVSINNKLYYSGDSLDVPHTPTDTLAVPITAPWMRIAEAMEFIVSLKPKQVFAVHDALLSDFGIQVNNRWLEQACEKVGAKYVFLKPGDSLEV